GYDERCNVLDHESCRNRLSPPPASSRTSSQRNNFAAHLAVMSIRSVIGRVTRVTPIRAGRLFLPARRKPLPSSVRSHPIRNRARPSPDRPPPSHTILRVTDPSRPSPRSQAPRGRDRPTNRSAPPLPPSTGPPSWI